LRKSLEGIEENWMKDLISLPKWSLTSTTV
jgi:hypothetical protein